MCRFRTILKCCFIYIIFNQQSIMSQIRTVSRTQSAVFFFHITAYPSFLEACGFFHASRIFYLISDSYFISLLCSMDSDEEITAKPFATGIVFAKYYINSTSFPTCPLYLPAGQQTGGGQVGILEYWVMGKW